MPGGRKRLLDSRVLMIAAVAVVGVALLASGSAAADTGAVAASRSGHVWGAAEEVPGTAALNRGDFADITVSCASAGNCSAGGGYTDSSGHSQAFVDSQVNGTWGPATAVATALNTGGSGRIESVSCASAGNCSAGGDYTDRSFHQQAFVVGQVNGTWHTAIEVPGTPALNQGGYAAITSVSCTSAGDCSAGGYYQVRSLHLQAFVDSET